MNDSLDKVQIIVLGALHTDIVVVGVPHLPGSGEDVYGPELRIVPGGKSRNIANMAARLVEPGAVAMLSRTSRDPYGLWKPPVDALEEAGVNTQFITVDEYADTKLFPGIALIAVDVKGSRNASISNTIVNSFTADDIDRAEPLFKAAAQHSGILALSMEMPFKTAVRSLELAAQLNLTTILDPGGLSQDADYERLLAAQIYLLKPNEHEARQLTGITVTNFNTAQQAAKLLMNKGVQHVLITHGERGAYLFGPNIEMQLPIPVLGKGKSQTDATGCGDQVMAALCAHLSDGVELTEATRLAVAAGTLQFHRVGVQPLSRADITNVI